MGKFLIIWCALVFSPLTLAIVDGHEYIFEESERAAVFKQLAEELRCPKCQNQNLADSNAMIAGDLRRELYQQVKQGASSEEIKDFMVNRYGEFVLYKPTVSAMTYVLWYGPGILLFLAVVSFILVVRHRKQSGMLSKPTSNLSTDEEQRLSRMLEDSDIDDALDSSDKKKQETQHD